MDEVADSIYFEATTESIYDQMVKMNADKSAFDEAVDEMNRIRAEKDLAKNEGIDISKRYDEQYQQLIQMMQEILNQDEKGFNLTTLSYDDEKDEDYEDEEWDEEEYPTSYEIPEDIDKNTLYLMKLYLDEETKTESIFKDMDAGTQKYEEIQLQAVNERIEDKNDYLAWKQAYLEEEYAKVKDRKFLTCKYLFAGIGQYETTIPAEEKQSFMAWIQANGSAFFGGERKATKEEIKRMIALNAPVNLE